MSPRDAFIPSIVEDADTDYTSSAEYDSDWPACGSLLYFDGNYTTCTDDDCNYVDF